MGKVKNQLIENQYQNGIIDDIFREYDYQSKKHFLKERPTRAKFSLVRLLDAIGCVICFLSILFFCLFLVRYAI
jgi:hypothetical protein